jgi:type III secretory pathway component EscS
MNLFEFLMILLSIIVGLGLAEILTGVARILRDGRQAEFSWIHSALVIAILLSLFQVFWESWSLQEIQEWTFPAMLLMLAAPILLFILAHVLFPVSLEYADLGEYYFARAKMLWTIALLTIVAGHLFRPLAFGMPWDAVFRCRQFLDIAIVNRIRATD